MSLYLNTRVPAQAPSLPVLLFTSICQYSHMQDHPFTPIKTIHMKNESDNLKE